MKIINNIPKGNVKAPCGAKLSVSSEGQNLSNDKFSNTEEFDIVFTPENKDENGNDIYIQNGMSQNDAITIGIISSGNEIRSYNLKKILTENSYRGHYEVQGLYRHFWEIDPQEWNLFQDVNTTAQVSYNEKSYYYVPRQSFNDDRSIIFSTVGNYIKSFTDTNTNNYGDGAFNYLFIQPYKTISFSIPQQGAIRKTINLSPNYIYFFVVTDSDIVPTDFSSLDFIPYNNMEDTGIPGQTFIRLEPEGKITFSGRTTKTDIEALNALYDISMSPTDPYYGNGVEIYTTGTIGLNANSINLSADSSSSFNISLRPFTSNAVQLFLKDDLGGNGAFKLKAITPDFICIAPEVSIPSSSSPYELKDQSNLPQQLLNKTYVSIPGTEYNIQLSFSPNVSQSKLTVSKAPNNEFDKNVGQCLLINKDFFI